MVFQWFCGRSGRAPSSSILSSKKLVFTNLVLGGAVTSNYILYIFIFSFYFLLIDPPHSYPILAGRSDVLVHVIISI